MHRRLFPLWVHLLDPATLGVSALAVFASIISVMPAGLIIFDRGFNNRRYFKELLAQGHHLLCRARKNDTFYYMPGPAEQPKKGRKRIYGRRVHIEHGAYTDLEVSGFEKPRSVAHQQVRTRMCPEPVHLVVVRTRPKKSKPYHYFLVYTTDLSLSVETILRYYTLRWGFETNMRDTKEELGFDHYQVRSERSINRSVLLSFVAASLTQLIAWPAFEKVHDPIFPAVEEGLAQMNIHWYHPKRWTLGLLLRYLRWQKRHTLFSLSSAGKKTTRKWIHTMPSRLDRLYFRSQV